MTPTEYERMGRFIYGAHRLVGVISSMHHWMADHMQGAWPWSDGSTPEAWCIESTALAKAYFAAHRPGEPASSFVQLLENVRDLEIACEAVRADTEGQLGSALERLHAAHRGLAEAIDQLGYHARTAAMLRECADALPVSAA